MHVSRAISLGDESAERQIMSFLGASEIPVASMTKNGWQPR